MTKDQILEYIVFIYDVVEKMGRGGLRVYFLMLKRGL
jgi:hypothetical protein